MPRTKLTGLPNPPRDAMFVRLKPHNAKRGHVIRKYTHLPSGKKFEEIGGWYRVDADLANTLREVHQLSHDPDSPLAFDVCTEAEAREIDKREKKARERRDPEEAHDLTTRGLRQGTETSPVDERRAMRARRSAASARA